MRCLCVGEQSIGGPYHAGGSGRVRVGCPRVCSHRPALVPPPFPSNFANHNKLKRQAMKVIAAAMPADEIAGLAEIFKAIDADGSGTITSEELSSALKEKGSLLRREDLEGLLALVDQDSSGCIDYEVCVWWVGGWVWGEGGSAYCSRVQSRAAPVSSLQLATRPACTQPLLGWLVLGLRRSSWRPP